MNDNDAKYVPCTPAGSVLMHLESDTQEEAWRKLLEDAAHMPYQGIEGFQERGYTVVCLRRVV